MRSTWNSRRISRQEVSRAMRHEVWAAQEAGNIEVLHEFDSHVVHYLFDTKVNCI